MKNKYFDKIRLDFAQSMISGNLPDKVTPELFNSGVTKLDIALDSFGLFDSASSNFNTFFPTVKPEDYKPAEEDYVKPIFRMLSEVIVNKKYNPVDFSKPGVLKNSMKKLLGQTVYPNHEASVGNELGAVSNVFWQDNYTTSSGIKVPAGINAELKIDAKSHPKIARSLTATPPSIHSNSVTVGFAWEPSHKFKTEDDFFRNIGLMGPDNTLVRRIASDILFYNETSLVRHGADPFAQILDKGTIINPEYANSINSLAFENKEKPKTFFFSYKQDLTSLEDTIPFIDNNNLTDNMKNYFLQLATLMGLTLDPNLEESALKSALETELAKINDLSKSAVTLQAQLTAATTEVTSVKAQLNTVTTELTSLKQKATENEPLIKVGTSTLEQLRTETQKAYSLVSNNTPDANIIATINSVDHQALVALNKQYTSDMERLFPMECTSCKGTAMSRRKTAVGSEGNPPKQTGNIIKELQDKKRKAKEPAFFQNTETE